MKPVTFEEWEKEWNSRGLKDDFDLARQNMIPADEAIKLDWKNKDKHAWITYSDHTGEVLHESPIFNRPTPTTKRQPKEGDNVFIGGDTNSIYKIMDISLDGKAICTSTGDLIEVAAIKPATIEQMGKPFDEIEGY
jgi:hypothetical protein